MNKQSVPSEFGGDAALQRLREKLHSRGLRLMVDFMPNHVAVDHPWTSSKPQLFIQVLVYVYVCMYMYMYVSYTNSMLWFMYVCMYVCLYTYCVRIVCTTWLWIIRKCL